MSRNIIEGAGGAPAPGPDAGRLRILVFVLRWIGFVSGTALVAAVMPLAWIDAAHRALGLGPLPAGPAVEYLARSTSFFYAALGGLFWIVASDPVRHARVLGFIVAVGLAGAPGLAVLDAHAGLPAWWRRSEGPMVFALCALLAVLAVRAGIWRRPGR